jgi:preprotein translocase subunit YajC
MKLIPDAMAQTPLPAAPAQSTPPTTTGVQASGAQPDPATQQPSLPDLFAQLVPIFVVMGIVYILVIRPRARREKEQLAQLRKDLNETDEKYPEIQKIIDAHWHD